MDFCRIPVESKMRAQNRIYFTLILAPVVLLSGCLFDDVGIIGRKFNGNQPVTLPSPPNIEIQKQQSSNEPPPDSMHEKAATVKEPKRLAAKRKRKAPESQDQAQSGADKTPGEPTEKMSDKLADHFLGQSSDQSIDRSNEQPQKPILTDRQEPKTSSPELPPIGDEILLGFADVAGASQSLVGTISGTGWKNRYGLTFNFATALVSTPALNGKNTSLTSLKGDFLFQIIQGTWNVDQVLGILASAQNVDYLGIQGGMAGLGAYWGRRILDHFLWDKPKWIEARFRYYLLPIGSVSLTSNYDFIILAKFFLGKSFFIFGALDFVQSIYYVPSTLDALNLSLLETTIGVGLSF